MTTPSDIVSQRCIGYQRQSDDSLASVIETTHRDGTKSWNMHYDTPFSSGEDILFEEWSGETLDYCPRIDIPNPVKETP